MIGPVRFVHDWYFNHGVPGNLAASAIWGSLAVTVGYFRVWKKHMRPHIERTAQIHRHLNPDDPYTIGDDDGASSSGR